VRTHIIRRLLITLVVVFLASFLTFLLLHITPGDPVYIMLGLNASPDLVASMRQELWLDRPFLVQYGHWLSSVLQGDFGRSLRYHQPVAELIKARMPVTLYLGLLSMILSTVVGLFAGVVGALRRGSLVDSCINVFANTGVALPVFWFGILMIYLFGLKLGWLPLSGYTAPSTDLWLSLKQAILPVTTGAVIPIAILTRQTRSSMLETINQDYVRTARAKGLREQTVLSRHALRNALIPIVTLIGLQVRWIVSGSVITETIFNIPGIGRLLVSSVLSKDFVVVQAIVLIIAFAVALSNLAVDIGYGWLDPRRRLD
jgi:peptide/nickel transport system permease protein